MSAGDVVQRNVAEEVRDFYERYQYPRPVEASTNISRPEGRTRRRADFHLFWPSRSWEDFSIQIAGCGTSQAAGMRPLAGSVGHVSTWRDERPLQEKPNAADCAASSPSAPDRARTRDVLRPDRMHRCCIVSSTPTPGRCAARRAEIRGRVRLMKTRRMRPASTCCRNSAADRHPCDRRWHS
jgi:hypothetical protein